MLSTSVQSLSAARSFLRYRHVAAVLGQSAAVPVRAEGATAANKDLWTRINAEYTDEQALRS